jgi:hypothetical protein
VIPLADLEKVRATSIALRGRLGTAPESVRKRNEFDIAVLDELIEVRKKDGK